MQVSGGVGCEEDTPDRLQCICVSLTLGELSFRVLEADLQIN